MTQKTESIVLIPAYQPDGRLITLLSALAAQPVSLLVVDDGSGPDYAPIFRQAAQSACVISHQENRGKGAALKTGLQHLAETRTEPYTVVTADADGQHSPEDVLRVLSQAARFPDHLVLGLRALDGNAPFRSRFGNAVTRGVFRLAAGRTVRDTQTGLRGFSSQQIPFLLAVSGDRYEYEMNVLLRWAEENRPISELEIAAIYLDGNNASHFQTLRDSYRIYKEIFKFSGLSFLKFSGASFLSFLVDYLLFFLFGLLTGSVVLANLAARGLSGALNYTLNRKLVFGSAGRVRQSALRYTALAAGILLCNTLILKGLTLIGIPPMAAKLATEAGLFLLSWMIQRTLVFPSESRKKELTVT